MNDGVHRKLAAILAADVAGYSRMMGEDSDRALRGLRQLRTELLAPTVDRLKGEVVKNMGDGWLVEFASVAHAVTCAIEIQEKLSKDDSIKVRIGVHLGDITHEDEDIFGDGINIAARLQDIAQPGCIVISDIARRSIDGKLAASFVDLGAHNLKNIAEPVTAFGWGMSMGASGARDLQLPDKPSIAVLPFTNMSHDPDQEYFSDGITDDITTDLSKVSGLFVIARNSTFIYKKKAVDIRQVSRKLGVRYILEGSVRRHTGSIRINAQLIDASSGNHLWAERYDGPMEDIFTLQDRITENIVAALAVTLTKAEQERAMRKNTADLKAYDYVLRGNAYHHRVTRKDIAIATEMYERAIELDPNYALAHAGLAWALVHAANHGWVGDSEASLDLALKHARRAVSLDDQSAKAHMVLGDVYCWTQRQEQAVAEARLAIQLDPSFADGHMTLAYYLLTTGKTMEAVEEAEKALRLNPMHPMHIYYLVLGISHYMLGNYEKAAEAGEVAAGRNPDSKAPFLLAAAYARLGRSEDAHRQASEALRVEPNFTISQYTTRSPYTQADTERYIEGWRMAGLPE